MFTAVVDMSMDLTWRPLRPMLRCSKVRVPPGTMLATLGLPLLPGAICHSASMSADFIGRSFTMMSTSTWRHCDGVRQRHSVQCPMCASTSADMTTPHCPIGRVSDLNAVHK